MKLLFYIVSFVGFFFPYILKVLISSPNAQTKTFAIFALGHYNLIYFAVVIIFFFAGLRVKFLQIAQILFVLLFNSYVLSDYFIFSKLDVEKYLNTHHLQNAKTVKISELKNYQNFKLYYKNGPYAVIEVLPKKEKKLPFNYTKDRAQ